MWPCICQLPDVITRHATALLWQSWAMVMRALCTAQTASSRLTLLWHHSRVTSVPPWLENPNSSLSRLATFVFSCLNHLRVTCFWVRILIECVSSNILKSGIFFHLCPPNKKDFVKEQSIFYQSGTNTILYSFTQGLCVGYISAILDMYIWCKKTFCWPNYIVLPLFVLTTQQCTDQRQCTDPFVLTTQQCTDLFALTTSQKYDFCFRTRLLYWCNNIPDKIQNLIKMHHLTHRSLLNIIIDI